MEPGTRLGHYTISSLIGKGGMGEVYQAKDEKLGRQVAIKVLPEEFAKDADRVARFRREAQLLASLNHPNIAAIHGLEEADGKHFLVLELVEGPTLEDRIEQGAIPVEESLKLALQIAEALEAAHEKGVIHRDLKPANIKVTPEGKVKVLDFGLAKALAADASSVDISNSPTLSMAATQQGVILGTAAYMSPEQASGAPADKRADIWAFGVVLFEMLTGRQAFTGKTVSHILADVLRAEPEWGSLPPNLHPRLRLLLESCLEKEAADRLSGISNARVHLQKVLADPSGVLVQPVPDVSQAVPQSKLPWVASVVLGMLVAGAAVWILRAPDPGTVSRFPIPLPEGQQFTETGNGLVDISPDGSRIVYVANRQIFVRTLNEMTAQPIPGIEPDEGPSFPFFSPDGESIGYVASFVGQLKKIATVGGTPVALVDIGGDDPKGISWGSDNVIRFGVDSGDIMGVSSNGGIPEVIIETGEGEWADGPQMLPGGEWLLFTLTEATGPTRWDEAHVVVESLESGERRVLWEGGSDARYVPTGHLVYAVEDILYAIPFDVNNLEVTGGPTPVIAGVQRGTLPNADSATANYGFSDDGSLVYVPEGISTAAGLSTLVMVDREGNTEFFTDELRNYRRPSISPDGTRVAVEVTDVSGGSLATHIWIVDIETGIGTQLTFEGSQHNDPVWTSDSQTVVFVSDRGVSDARAIYSKAADGRGEAELVYQGERGVGFLRVTDALADGTLVFHEANEEFGSDIKTVGLDGDGSVSELLTPLVGPGGGSAAFFSPDGQWMAYQSAESGQTQIYVRPYPPSVGGQRRISDGGGVSAVWSADGRELYYIGPPPRSLMRVSIDTDPSLLTGRPEALFPISERGFQLDETFAFSQVYDVTPSGERFVFVQSAGQGGTDDETSPQINVVQNWFEELKERVPIP